MIEKIIKVLKEERRTCNDDDFCIWADDDDLLILAKAIKEAINNDY